MLILNDYKIRLTYWRKYFTTNPLKHVRLRCLNYTWNLKTRLDIINCQLLEIFVSQRIRISFRTVEEND